MLNYFSPSARRLRALVRVLRPGQLNTIQLMQLRDDLIAWHAELPTGMLWKILDQAQAAVEATLDTPLTALFQDIHYSAERALAIRNRAGRFQCSCRLGD